MSTLYIIDIDGTLADCSRRYKKAGKEPSRRNKKAYDAWVARVQNARSLLADKPVAGMLELLSNLPEKDIYYVTSRENKWREYTYKWLARNRFPFKPAVHRENGDYRSSAKMKEEVIKRYLGLTGYKTAIVIDDDPKGDIERMCKRNKYTFLKAKSGS